MAFAASTSLIPQTALEKETPDNSRQILPEGKADWLSDARSASAHAAAVTEAYQNELFGKTAVNYSGPVLSTTEKAAPATKELIDYLSSKGYHLSTGYGVTKNGERGRVIQVRMDNFGLYQPDRADPMGSFIVATNPSAASILEGVKAYDARLASIPVQNSIVSIPTQSGSQSPNIPISDPETRRLYQMYQMQQLTRLPDGEATTLPVKPQYLFYVPATETRGECLRSVDADSTTRMPLLQGRSEAEKFSGIDYELAPEALSNVSPEEKVKSTLKGLLGFRENGSSSGTGETENTVNIEPIVFDSRSPKQSNSTVAAGAAITATMTTPLSPANATFASNAEGVLRLETQRVAAQTKSFTSLQRSPEFWGAVLSEGFGKHGQDVWISTTSSEGVKVADAFIRQLQTGDKQSYAADGQIGKILTPSPTRESFNAAVAYVTDLTSDGFGALNKPDQDEAIRFIKDASSFSKTLKEHEIPGYKDVSLLSHLTVKEIKGIYAAEKVIELRNAVPKALEVIRGSLGTDFSEKLNISAPKDAEKIFAAGPIKNLSDARAYLKQIDDVVSGKLALDGTKVGVTDLEAAQRLYKAAHQLRLLSELQK